MKMLVSSWRSRTGLSWMFAFFTLYMRSTCTHMCSKYTHECAVHKTVHTDVHMCSKYTHKRAVNITTHIGVHMCSKYTHKCAVQGLGFRV